MKRWQKAGLAVLALAGLLAVAAWLTFRLPSFGGVPEGARLDRMRLSRQFHEGRFENSPPYVRNLSFAGEMKAFFGEEIREPTLEVPVHPDPQCMAGRTAGIASSRPTMARA